MTDRPRLLLLGGTRETRALADALVAAGYEVLVSTATDAPLDLGVDPRTSRRCGRLDLAAMTELVRSQSIALLVDAGHPYAVALHATAREAAAASGVKLLLFSRPGVVEPREADGRSVVVFARDHAEAAEQAFAGAGAVLLTTGSRNLRPYAEASRRSGMPLVVRVLPHPESLAACREMRLAPENVVAARGPFTVQDNRELIRKFTIRTLVTKDSGEAGGVLAKLEAARQEDCRVVVVQRPEEQGEHFTDIRALAEAARAGRAR
jgi:precorrin-6A/cobalt-precorrin-6A reductase